MKIVEYADFSNVGSILEDINIIDSETNSALVSEGKQTEIETGQNRTCVNTGATQINEVISREPLGYRFSETDGGIIGGLRDFFSSFSDKMTRTIWDTIENIVKKDTEMRRELHEMRPIIEPNQEIPTKPKQSSLSCRRFLKTVKMDTDLENVEFCFADAMVIRVPSSVINNYLLTRPLSALMDPPFTVDVVD